MLMNAAGAGEVWWVRALANWRVHTRLRREGVDEYRQNELVGHQR